MTVVQTSFCELGKRNGPTAVTLRTGGRPSVLQSGRKHRSMAGMAARHRRMPRVIAAVVVAAALVAATDVNCADPATDQDSGRAGPDGPLLFSHDICIVGAGSVVLRGPQTEGVPGGWHSLWDTLHMLMLHVTDNFETVAPPPPRHTISPTSFLDG